MYIDKVDIKGWGKALQMPIEYEIRKALEKLGYKVEEEKNGLFDLLKTKDFISCRRIDITYFIFFHRINVLVLHRYSYYGKRTF